MLSFIYLDFILFVESDIDGKWLQSGAGSFRCLVSSHTYPVHRILSDNQPACDLGFENWFNFVSPRWYCLKGSLFENNIEACYNLAGHTPWLTLLQYLVLTFVVLIWFLGLSLFMWVATHLSNTNGEESCYYGHRISPWLYKICCLCHK
jgi:hypothetical protein